jgi:hypothetical protein
VATTKLHIEDALNFLIEQLATIASASPASALSRHRVAHGSDIWINDVCDRYWQAHGQIVAEMPQDDKEAYIAPFYDAAWELSRRGVLRPGAAISAGQTSGNQIGQRVPSAPFFGDGYALTAWGRRWVLAAVSERMLMPSDHGRFSEVLHDFRTRFGDGYAQRAAEAVADWRAGNYLSACTMAGAAAESVLLATAIAKTTDESAVLAEYRTVAGRSRVIKRVTASVTSAMAERFTNALGLLTYWRDEAGHGTPTNIGEVEAHEAILGLLRLARLASDNWTELTK